MSPQDDQPGDLLLIPMQYGGRSTSSGLLLYAQEPASITYGYEGFSSLDNGISPLSQPLHDVSQTQQLSLQTPLLRGCFDENYQLGSCGNNSNIYQTPNTRTPFDTSSNRSQYLTDISKTLKAPDMEEYFDMGHHLSQDSMHHPKSAQPQNSQPYLNARHQWPQEFIYYPNITQMADIESHAISAQLPKSGQYLDPSYQEPSNCSQQFTYPFNPPNPAVSNPLSQYHEIRPLMDNPHFQESRSYDLRQEYAVHHSHGDNLQVANALQNVLTQQKKGSTAAEQAYLSRMERHRIGNCPSIGVRREKRRRSEQSTSQHFQPERTSKEKINTESEDLDSASKSLTSIEKVVFTTPTITENFMYPFCNDDMMQKQSPAKKRKTSGSIENPPSCHESSGAASIILQSDAVSTPSPPLTPATLSNLLPKSPGASLPLFSQSQVADISIPARHRTQPCEKPNVGLQPGSLVPHSTPLAGCPHQIIDTTLPHSPPLILGPDRNIPWPGGVPWPVGRCPVPIWNSTLPKNSPATISDQVQYSTPDVGFDISSELFSVPIISSNDQDGKVLPDKALSDKALSGNDDTAFSILNMPNASEPYVAMLPIKHQYVFSFQHHLIMEKQFGNPFRPYVYPDIGKFTFTKCAAIPQDLGMEDIDGSDGV